MGRSSNIQARRQLKDLFKQGTEVRFGRSKDGKPEGRQGPFVGDDGKPIPLKQGEMAVFVHPPDPVQRDTAIRAGQGARAAALIKAKRDVESPEHLTILAFLADMSNETLIDYVVLGDAPTHRQEAEREILGLDEWKDFTAYQDAMANFEQMSEDELEGNAEYEAMMELDEKFGDQVLERERELAAAQREALRFVPREQVERKALEKRAEIVGSQAFMAEYERQMFYYSIRDPENIDQMFFDGVHEAAAMPEEFRVVIEEALMPFITEAGEAKNSQRAASGSDSSELPDNPETSDSSTPKEQIA